MARTRCSTAEMNEDSSLAVQLLSHLFRTVRDICMTYCGRLTTYNCSMSVVESVNVILSVSK